MQENINLKTQLNKMQTEKKCETKESNEYLRNVLENNILDNNILEKELTNIINKESHFCTLCNYYLCLNCFEKYKNNYKNK